MCESTSLVIIAVSGHRVDAIPLPDLAVESVLAAIERTEIYEDHLWISWHLPATDTNLQALSRSFLSPLLKISRSRCRIEEWRLLPLPEIWTYKDEIVSKLFFECGSFSRENRIDATYLITYLPTYLK